MPRKRTGSSGSRVPPALTTTRRPARSWARARRAGGQHDRGEGGDLGRLGQPALAGVGAGEPADGRRQHDGAAAAQRGDVVLGGRVLPHLGVHGRREHHRAARGEQRGGEQVVGPARARRGRAGRRWPGRRRRGRPAGRCRTCGTSGDVGPDVGGDRVARQRRPGGRADEVQRARGRHDADVVPGLGERAQQQRRPCRRRCRR